MKLCLAMKLCFVLIPCIVTVHALQVSQRPFALLPNVDNPSSRRQVLSTIASSLILVPSSSAVAETSSRESLLTAIESGAPDATVLGIIDKLKDSASVNAERLDGQWELLWSVKADAFSPLLTLPKPFKPLSYQYFGKEAENEVGEGRLAQGLTGGVLGENQLWLSSGGTPVREDPSILEIQPPFRWEVGGRYATGKPKRMIVEAGSDADFRKVNARNKEAQSAGKNQYQQIYLEENGPGSLRISTITSGDPVIVGAVFVHRKL